MCKTKILTAAFLLLTITGFSQSTKRQSSSHTQIIKLGINTFFDYDEFPFSISWEKKVATNQSIQIGFLPRFRTTDGDKTNGVGFNIAYRKYISKNRTGINGLFISPIAKVGFLKESNSYSYNNYGTPPQIVAVKYEDNTTQYSVGLVFGHNWVYKSGFSFELSAGMAYYNSTDKNTNTNNNVVYKNNYQSAGILPQFQCSIGYAF